MKTPKEGNEEEEEKRNKKLASLKTQGGELVEKEKCIPASPITVGVILGATTAKHFVLEENMLEVDCPCVTPEVVLKASDHVDKFTDLMVRDEKTGTCYQDDHLLKDFYKEKLEKGLSLTVEKAAKLKHVLAILDDLSFEQLGAKLKDTMSKTY
ncbi:hypothetical protein MRB53_006045 [Persea americana]|uniref:Uncharacterized protein n=1 Tax=Persea americana TaxID=3435 RepID=A0ACC2MGL6_PERAE|nr:hypothetical protein MRB53_006045 [Persea americana]